MKPIEPGCLCLAYDPKLTHAQKCTAVRFVGKGESITVRTSKGTFKGTAGRDFWVVKEILSYAEYEDASMCDANKIMRIDGGEETQKEREREKETA